MRRKVIAITGATSGFGAAMTRKFASENYQLVINARDEGKLNNMTEEANKLGGLTIPVAGDITQPGTLDRMVTAAVDHFGGVDVMINNAGCGFTVGDLDELSSEDIDNILALNLRAVIDGCRAVIPPMKEQGYGQIINLTSACAKFAWPGWSVYSAAKTGVLMMSRCLHAELQKHNIYVSVITPGGCKTNFQNNCGLPSRTWDESKTLRPEHIARTAYNLVTMPEGAVVPETVVYGMLQEIVPF